MGEKLSTEKDPQFPGPGYYNAKCMKVSAPQVSIGKSTRMSEKSESMPGPGYYSTPTSSSKHITIPKGPKVIKVGEDNELGPGTYSLLHEGPDKSKGITIGEKFKDRGTEDMPGPGQYTVGNAPGGPAYTIARKHGQKEKSSERENDRFYEVAESFKKCSTKVNNTVIGTSKRKDELLDDNPGPGSYNLVYKP